MSPSGDNRLLVEFIALGNAVKATVVDPVTGLEASVMGPSGSSQAALADAARRKLEFLKRKKP